MKRLLRLLRPHTRGQAMVEFIIALPVLLLLLFGIIEFGRMIFAWMAVQNAARFGMRYAITGEFDAQYCDEAGSLLGSSHQTADADDGTIDCRVAEDYGGDPNMADDLEIELIDMARLFSIRDVAIQGGTGLWLDESTAGNYLQLLLTHQVSNIGNPSKEGYIHVTICSTRLKDNSDENRFLLNYENELTLCVDDTLSDPNFMDDAGGPGNQVMVIVTHRHPLLLPFVATLWPSVELDASRIGTVEQFRTSRVMGFTSGFQGDPTDTFTPSLTFTPSDTPTASNTPTSSNTPTATEMSCDDYTMGDFSFFNNKPQLRMWVNNAASEDVNVTGVRLDWSHAEAYYNSIGQPGLFVNWFKWGGSNFYNGDDFDSPTNSSGNSLLLQDADSERIDIRFGGIDGSVALQGVTSDDLGIRVELDNGCIIEREAPPLETQPTPTLSCSSLSLSGDPSVKGRNKDKLEFNIVNSSAYHTFNLSRVFLSWQEYQSNMLVNLMQYRGSSIANFNFWNGTGNSPPTDTSVDPGWLGGDMSIPPGQSRQVRIDFNPNGILNGVPFSDFSGTQFDFDENCSLNYTREADTATPTPTNTSTPTNTATPTNTPIPDCNLYNYGSFYRVGDGARIQIANNNIAGDPFLTRTEFWWPTSPSRTFDKYRRIETGSNIKNPSNTSSGYKNITGISYSSSSRLPAGTSGTFEFDFTSNITYEGYEMRATFYWSDGCTYDTGPVITPTASNTPTITNTATNSLTPSITPSPTQTYTPSLTPTPTATFEPVYVNIINPVGNPTITDRSQTRFQAVAWDPVTGTWDGAGINRVQFRILGPAPSTTQRDFATEYAQAYCGFGGNSPCSMMDQNYWDSWPNGTYTIQARAQANGTGQWRWSSWDTETFVLNKPPTPTPTKTFTPTETFTATSTFTATNTFTPTHTFTPTFTFTPTYTNSPVNTPTNTNTPAPEPTATPTNTSVCPGDHPLYPCITPNP